MTFTADNIPAELRALPRWVNWRLADRAGKKTKIPLDPNTGRNAAADDPDTWSTFDTARGALDRDGTLAGLGFVFNGDGLAGLDLDHVIDDAGNLDPEAAAIVESLATYTERSQSGTGLHCLMRATLPEGRGRRKGNVELYSTGRFFIMTGDRWAGTPATLEPRQEQVDALRARLFPPAEKPEPRAARPVDLGDRELIERATAAANGAKFSALWRGDWRGAGYGSQSEADAALLGLLRFWTGGDKGRSFALFSQSGLVREKWGRADYRESTWAAVDAGEVYAPEQAGSARRTPRAEPDADGEAWPPLVPFNTPADAPTFPLEVLPEPFRTFAAEVAESRQVPVDLPAVLVLGVAAIAAAKRYKVEVGRTHTEPLNLFLLPLLEPGERKTITFQDCLRPVEEYETELTERARPEIAREIERRAATEERIKELRRRAGKEDDPDKRAALVRECEDMAAGLGAIPTLPRLLAGDVTPEHLAHLLQENGGRIAQVDAEGGTFFNLTGGQYAKNGAGNFEIYLRAHAGDYLRVDRMTRTGESVREPALTMILTGQPAILRALPNREALRGRGLLARFIYCLPRSRVGQRGYVNRPIDEAARAAYARAVRRMLETPDPATPENPDAYFPLRIAGDALAVWTEYYNRVESALGPDGELHHIRDWAGKLAGAAARIASLLHVMAGADGPDIPAATVAGAWAIGVWSKYHALAAFEVIGGEQDEAPRRVLAWIARHGLTRFNLAGAFDALRRGMPEGARSDDLLPAMDTLEVRGYVRPLPERPRAGAGRKRSPEYETNPAFLGTP